MDEYAHSEEPTSTSGAAEPDTASPSHETAPTAESFETSNEDATNEFFSERREEEETLYTATDEHEFDRESRASKKSKTGKKKKKGAKGPKKKKLNRKAIYKNLKQMSKAMDEMKNVQEKLAWEKEKLFFYWDFATNKYLKMDQQLVNWRRKREAFKLQNQHGYFLETWRQMNNSRNMRQEAIAIRRKQYNSWITRVLDEHREQGYRLTKDICDESRQTLNTGQNYVTRLVNKRKEFTEDLTKMLEEWRPLMKGTERQLQGHYGKIFQDETAKQNVELEKIPADRELRLKEQQLENNRLLKEVLSVYDNLISHNFVEILHLAKDINQLKTQDRRIREKRDEIFKLYTSMKDRMDFLRERVSSLKRQVHAGRKVRTNLLEVLQEQDCLEFRKDVALIRNEWVANEVANAKMKTAELNDLLLSSFFSVKKHLFKNVIRSAGRAKERSLQLKNYAQIVESKWGQLADVDYEPHQFKKNEEIEYEDDGVKVVLGNFRPYTLDELQARFVGCADSYTAAVVFFQRRLKEQCLSLDDLEFFIRRRSPVQFPSLGHPIQRNSRVGDSTKHPFDTSFSDINIVNSLASLMVERKTEK